MTIHDRPQSLPQDIDATEARESTKPAIERKGQVEEAGRPRAIVVRSRAMALAVFAAVLAALSFHGALDDFAHEQVADTTAQSMGIYATARVINGAISVLQTSQVKVPLLASLQVGELLDPVNDAVERLSSALAWAIGSLFLQRIVLEATSGPVFKWAFFATGLAAISALLLCGWNRSRNVFLRSFALPEAMLHRCRSVLLRAFVIAVIFRFIVPVFIVLGFLLSQMLLDSEIDRNGEALSSFGAQIQIGSVVAPSVDDRPLADQKSRQEAELEEFEDALASLRQKSESLDVEIDAHEKETGLRGWLPEWLGGRPPGKELASARAKREDTGREMDRVQEKIGEGRNTLECIERRLAGESCESFWDKLSSAGETGYARIREIGDLAADMATSTTRLLAAVVIKNIVIPLLFLTIAVKCSVPIIRYSMRLVEGTRREAGTLRNLPEPTDREG